jgi:hypothetical protein
MCGQDRRVRAGGVTRRPLCAGCPGHRQFEIIIQPWMGERLSQISTNERSTRQMEFSRKREAANLGDYLGGEGVDMILEISRFRASLHSVIPAKRSASRDLSRSPWWGRVPCLRSGTSLALCTAARTG